MYTIKNIHPTQEQLSQFISGFPENTPVTMINIIRYKATVGTENKTGEEIYHRYATNVIPVLNKAGGKMIWRGTVHNTIIGSDAGHPHIIMLVTYPTKNNFLTMIASPEYQKVSQDRTISLEYGGLLAATTDYSSAEK